MVAKFYRPTRWPDEAILEEHAFIATLAEREIPVVPALAIDGRALEPYRHRQTMDTHSFGIEPSKYLLAHDSIPAAFPWFNTQRY